LFWEKKLDIGLIGVSNSIDAMEKYWAKEYCREWEIQNVVFVPYNNVQIQVFMQDKLAQLNNKLGV